ncbi:unnamed protein product [Rhizophagus irregularis]|nr:unnamed protein product [Rhizophagus irregularis]
MNDSSIQLSLRASFAINETLASLKASLSFWPSSTRVELAAIFLTLFSAPENATVNIHTDSLSAIYENSSTPFAFELAWSQIYRHTRTFLKDILAKLMDDADKYRRAPKEPSIKLKARITLRLFLIHLERTPTMTMRQILINTLIRSLKLSATEAKFTLIHLLKYFIVLFKTTYGYRDATT